MYSKPVPVSEFGIMIIIGANVYYFDSVPPQSRTYNSTCISTKVDVRPRPRGGRQISPWGYIDVHVSYRSKSGPKEEKESLSYTLKTPTVSKCNQEPFQVGKKSTHNCEISYLVV